MNAPLWRYIGSIDCFGMDEDQRDTLFSAWGQAAVELGGDFQIQPDDNQWDTDRYTILAYWPEAAGPFADWVGRLAMALPDDHTPIRFEGYLPESMQREDILVEEQNISLLPYVMVPAQAIPYQLDRSVLALD